MMLQDFLQLNLKFSPQGSSFCCISLRNVLLVKLCRLPCAVFLPHWCLRGLWSCQILGIFQGQRLMPIGRSFSRLLPRCPITQMRQPHLSICGHCLLGDIPSTSAECVAMAKYFNPKSNNEIIKFGLCNQEDVFFFMQKTLTLGIKSDC